MKTTILVAALLLLAALAAPTSAQAGRSMSVAEMSVGDASELSARSLAFNLRGTTEGERRITLEADKISVEIHRNENEVYVIGAYPNYTYETLYEGPGRLVTDTMRGEHQMVLVAQDADVTLHADEFKAKPKTGETFSRTGHVASDRKEEFHMGPQFALTNLTTGRLEVEGSFSFTLWDWDGVVEHAGGRDPFWTGRQHDAAVDGLPYGGSAAWQVAFVYVEGGRLSMDLLKEDTSESYMGPARGLFGGDIRVTAPAEESSSDEPLDEVKDKVQEVTGATGSTSSFDGLHEVVLDVPSPGSFYATFSKPKPAAPAEQPPSEQAESPNVLPEQGSSAPELGSAGTPVPTLPDASLPSWTYLLVLPALALTAAGVVFLRPIHRMRKLEDAYDLSIFGYIVDNGLPLLRSRRFGRQASVMYTVALLEERGPEAAEAHLREVRPRSRPSGATYEYLMARIRAAQTRFDEARRHVQSCLDSEPAFVVEIKHNPTLEFLMRPPSDPGDGYA